MFKKIVLGLFVGSVIVTGVAFSTVSLADTPPVINEQLTADDITDLDAWFNALLTTDSEFSSEQKTQLKQLFETAKTSNSDADWQAFDQFLSSIDGVDLGNLEDEADDDISLDDDLDLLKSAGIALTDAQSADLARAFKQAKDADSVEAWDTYDELFLSLLELGDACEGGNCATDTTQSLDDITAMLNDVGVALTEAQHAQLKALYDAATASGADSDWQAFDDYLSSVSGAILDDIDTGALTLDSELKWLAEAEVKLSDEQRKTLEKLFNAAQTSKSDADWDTYFEFFANLLPSDEATDDEDDAE